MGLDYSKEAWETKPGKTIMLCGLCNAECDEIRQPDLFRTIWVCPKCRKEHSDERFVITDQMLFELENSDREQKRKIAEAIGND